MFAFRKARPPLSTFQRVDIELLMRRTIEIVGSRHVCEINVVADLSELDLDLTGPRELLSSALQEVKSRMPVIVQPCEVGIADASLLGYPSTYDPATGDTAARIQIADETLADPLRTVIELSYQYANHFWRNIPNPVPLDTDPRTTHLMPICCGLGVLASDACLYDEQWSQAGWTGWSISRSGYYNAVEIGYALALLARWRGEANPDWARQLRLDSKDTAQKAWRYFDQHERQGGSLLFDAGKVPASTCDMRELAEWLRGDDRAFALAAGFALAKLDDLSPLVIEAAMEATRSRDKDLVPLATRLLGRARRANVAAERRIRELLRSDSPHISIAAMESAGAMGMPLVDFGAKISKLLDVFAQDAFVLVDIIRRQGEAFEFMGPKICEHIARAIRESDDERTAALLECLQHIVKDPHQSIQTLIKSPEVRKEALQRLTSAR